MSTETRTYGISAGTQICVSKKGSASKMRNPIQIPETDSQLANVPQINTNIPYKSNDMFDWSQKNPQRPQSDDQGRNQVLCLKPKAILTSHDAVNIFKRSLPHFTPKNTSAVVVAQEYRVSEKAIRDIWTGRTWSEATDHLAPHRAPRTPRPTGRPRGRLDTKPRKQRACVKFTGLKPAAPSSKSESTPPIARSSAARREIGHPPDSRNRPTTKRE